jgi:hypothetical protein
MCGGRRRQTQPVFADEPQPCRPKPADRRVGRTSMERHSPVPGVLGEPVVERRLINGVACHRMGAHVRDSPAAVVDVTRREGCRGIPLLSSTCRCASPACRLALAVGYLLAGWLP